ncbi:unnamed protein product, partial [Didymodactylos carnosus]
TTSSSHKLRRNVKRSLRSAVRIRRNTTSNFRIKCEPQSLPENNHDVDENGNGK